MIRGIPNLCSLSQVGGFPRRKYSQYDGRWEARDGSDNNKNGTEAWREASRVRHIGFVGYDRRPNIPMIGSLAEKVSGGSDTARSELSGKTTENLTVVWSPSPTPGNMTYIHRDEAWQDFVAAMMGSAGSCPRCCG